MHMEHDHTHGHDHACDHCHGAKPAPKDIALLKYMLEHNRDHARELSETGLKLGGGAAELISEAVHYFEHGNEKLQKAVELITREG